MTASNLKPGVHFGMSETRRAMRQPTDAYAAFEWWRNALDKNVAAISSQPQCGFFKRKLVKGGVFVPVAIWLQQMIDAETGELTGDERLLCSVNGIEADADAQWLYCAGHPITESEYHYMTARMGWSREHEPSMPHAMPAQKIDINQIPPPF